MGKVIKISVKILTRIFSAAVLLLIILPLSLSLLLSLPAFQNFAVDRAASLASRKLGTTVSIRHVDIGLFNRLHIDGMYVEDLQHDTLLYVGHLDGIITGIGLLGGGISLSSAHISNADLNMRERDDSVMNIKQVVDRLSNPDRERKGNFRLSISSLKADSLNVTIERLEHRNPEYGVDYGNIRMRDICGRLEDFEIAGSAISTTVEHMSLREASGAAIDRMTGGLRIDRGFIALDNAEIKTDRTWLDIPRLQLAGDEWSDYKYFIDSVAMECSVSRSTLSSDDLAFFAPRFRTWDMTLSDASVYVQGKVSDMFVDIARARTGESTRLSAKGTVTGLPDFNHAQFDMEVTRFDSSGDDIEHLAKAVANASLPANITDIISRAGSIGVTGTFKGTFASFASRAVLTTDAGRADLNLRRRSQRGGDNGIMGNIAAHNLHLGRLLNNGTLGRLNMTVHIDGTLGENSDAAIDGKIDLLEVNGYPLDSIRLDGRLAGNNFDGRIHAANPALRFDFDGLMEMESERPHYDFCMDLDHADLFLLGVNRRDSVALLSAHIDAEGVGRSLDDLNGRIEVENARYVYNADTAVARHILIEGRNTENDKNLRLTSDLADASFIGRSSYKEAFAYLSQSLHNYIPSFFEPSERERKHLQRTSTAAPPDAFSILDVRLKNFNAVADAVSPGLQLADNTQMKLMFNPASGYLSLSGSSDFFEHNRMLATKIEMNLSNAGDSLSVYAHSEDLYAGTFFAANPTVIAGAKNDRVTASARFADTARMVSGRIGLTAEVWRDEEVGRKIALNILPSDITRRNSTWSLFSRRIEIDSTKVLIDRFRMMNDQQELQINGIASRSREDSLTMNLKNFDLGAFTQFVERMGYTVEGTTNGYATVKSALGGAEITANILMDSVMVNNIPSPALVLDSRWDFAESRARFFACEREHGDTLVRGYYDPSQRRYYMRAEVDSMRLALIDPVLQGVVSETEGVARMELVLRGKERDASLHGQIHVNGLKTKVDFTQVEYTAPEFVLDIENNAFSGKGIRLYDPEGNHGTADFNMSLQHLSNISYSMRVRPERMLVLDTSEKDNEYFYGKIHASGSADIRGDKRGVTMNIVATTEEGSDFFMPLSGKSNVAQSDFVIFESGNHPDTTNYLVRKRMMFERRQRSQSGGGNMDINLALNVQPTTNVQLLIDPAMGDVIKGRGEGMLNLHINPHNNIFEMYGDYTITEGSYRFNLMNIVSKPFTIESGSTIMWTGEPLDALLNINAIYTVKTSLAPLTDDFANDRAQPVNCYIIITGRLTSPDVRFDIKVPTADSELQTVLANTLNTQETIARQVMYLLVLNNFVSDNDAASAAGAGASTGLSLLTSQLSNLLSGEEYNINIRYRPKSETTGTGDEVDLGFSKSLINDRLLVEVEGNYVVDNRSATNAQQMSSFMGEAYITWLIDRAGTLRLKGFTQNIDRFDENQGLQETGIGIYYKEDFNNFRDLRRRVRERFMSKKKRERLAAEADSLSAAAAKHDVIPEVQPAAAETEAAAEAAANENRNNEETNN